MSDATCRVCDNASNGVHFGVSVCRACAAFFRRTVALKLGYKCRENTQRCTFKKGTRNACRGCRFLKCQLVGMKADNVQMLRERYGKRPKGGQSKDEREINKTIATIGPKLKRPNILVECIATIFHNMVSEMRANISTPQLTRLLCAYAKYKQKRGSASAVRERIIYNRKSRTASMHGVLEMIQSKEGCEAAAYQATLIAKFLGSVDAFVILPISQKWAVFKRFWPRFLLLDDIGKGYQADYDEYQRRLAYGIEPLYPCGPFRDLKFNALRMQLVIIPLGNLHLDDIEFVSLFAITLWSLEERETIDEETIFVAAEAKLEIFNDLHQHYVATRSAFEAPNYALRIASMSAIMHTLDAFILKRRDDMKALMMINALNEEDLPEILAIADIT